VAVELQVLADLVVQVVVQVMQVVIQFLAQLLQQAVENHKVHIYQEMLVVLELVEVVEQV
jgi:hypothetical protein